MGNKKKNHKQLGWRFSHFLIALKMWLALKGENRKENFFFLSFLNKYLLCELLASAIFNFLPILRSKLIDFFFPAFLKKKRVAESVLWEKRKEGNPFNAVLLFSEIITSTWIAMKVLLNSNVWKLLQVFIENLRFPEVNEQSFVNFSWLFCFKGKF